MVKKIRRKVKKITMKASLVKMELEDLSEENEENQKKLASDFSDEFKFLEWKRKSKDTETTPEPKKPLPSDDDSDLDTTSYEAPTEIKKLYRKIALKTHPDRIEDEYLNEIFRQAAHAMEEENWMLIVELCGELSLDIDFLSDETCEIIEESISKNSQQIAVIKNSFSYMWAKQRSDKEKDMYTKLFYKQHGINLEEFSEWLAQHKDTES